MFEGMANVWIPCKNDKNETGDKDERHWIHMSNSPWNAGKVHDDFGWPVWADAIEEKLG